MDLKVDVYIIVNAKPKTIFTKYAIMNGKATIDSCNDKLHEVLNEFIDSNKQLPSNMLGVKGTLVIW